MDKMREEFEEWLDQGNHCGCNENMWKAWQAAQSAAVPVVGEPGAQNPSRMCVVFDGPPSSEAPRFIEVEDGNGNSINAGEWLKRDDGLWELRLIAPLPLSASTAISVTAAEIADLREKAAMAEVEQEEKAKFAFKCAALSAELDALRKDAERYRWLRMKGAHSHAVDNVHMFGPQLDTAIDAAIAGEK